MFSRIRQSKQARTCHVLDNGFTKVVPGLAVTPSQMARMTAQGIPISSQLAENFVDGTSNPSFDIPIEQRRGIDVVQVWEAQKDARLKIINAHKADKQMYD